VQEAWDHKRSLNWWVAPSYAQSKMAYGLIKRLLPPNGFLEYKSDLRLTLLEPDGSERSVIEFKSADNPDSLRGYAVNFFILDEAARMDYEAYVSAMTTVTQTMGRGIIISTPKGGGWFRDVYAQGEKFYEDGMPKFGGDVEDPFPEWLSIRMPTWMNPHVKLQAIEDMRRNLPSDVFRQEVGAQFLLDSAGVFRGTRGCVKGLPEPPQAGHGYVIGVDLARLQDFTVLTVMDRARRHVVDLARFTQVHWDVQINRIINLARAYNFATLVVDSTGIGDPIVQTLESAGMNVVPYKISSHIAKSQLIDKLRLSIEQQRISYPRDLPHFNLMLKELETYEYEISAGGVTRYSAPRGYYDDCVISLALATWVADSDPWIYRHFSARGI
jgi:hypothetical protein